MLTIFSRWLLASALLTCLLAGRAHAQNPVVPGQSPLRRLSPPTGQPGAATPGQVVPGTGNLDSLRTLSGRY